jgi:hypothetical protein
MADNLTVQISADSSKLRADLAMAQSKVREFGKEVKKAADEARKTGDPTRLREVSAEYEKMAAEVRGLNRALADTNKTAAGTAQQVGGIAGAVDNVGIAAMRAQTALRALFALQGARQAAAAIDNVYNKINELNKEAIGTGFTPQGVATVKEILGDVGVNADGSRQALAKFNEVMIESQEKLGLLKDGAKGAASGVKEMRGDVSNLGDGMVQVMRGGQKPAEDTTTAVGKLTDAMRGIGKAFDIRQFKTNEDRIRGVAGALAELTKIKPDLAASLGRDFFGRNYAEIAAGILKIGEAWDQTQADLTQSGRMPTPADDAALKTYLAAVDAIGDAWEAAQKKAVLATHGTTIELLNNATKLVEAASRINTAFDQFTKDSGVPLGGNLVANTIAEFEALKTLFTVTVPEWGRTMSSELMTAFVDIGTGFSDAFTRAFANIKTAASELSTWLSEKIAAAWSAFSRMNTYDPITGTVVGRAAGGMIRGPGSGTSDSIMARLSNGEFVMRAAAVRHWGPQLLGAMNALNRPLRGIGDGKGFANGGLVSATTSDGATVNLHFPGGSFSLRGDKGIVQGLTREARRAALLSGGRLPGAALA